MKSIEYSLSAVKKLESIKKAVSEKYGESTAAKVVGNILKAVNSLGRFENKGKSVYKLTGVFCEYRVLFVAHNYIFYVADKEKISVIDIFNEREDFMQKLFGVKYV